MTASEGVGGRPDGGQFQLLDAVPTLVWMVDSGGHLTYVNPAWSLYTGTSQAEALGASFAHAIHHDDREAALTRWASARPGAQPFRAEFRLRRADGEYRWHLGEGRPVPAPGGVQTWIGSCTDIHDHRGTAGRLEGGPRAEAPRAPTTPGAMFARLAALQRLTSLLAGVQEERALLDVLFREGLAAFGAAEGALLVVAGDGEAVDVMGSSDPATPRRVPLDAAQAGPEALRRGEALFLPTRQDALAAYPQEAQETVGRGVFAVAALPFGSGPQRGALVLSFPRTQTFDAPERAFLITLAEQTGQALARVRLVTAERAARAAAAHSERRYRTLLEAVTSVVWTVGDQGQDETTRAWWSELSGQTPEEAWGEDGWGWLAALHPDDRERSRAVWQRALQERHAFSNIYRVCRPGVDERVVEVRGAPHLGEDGTLIEWVGSYTDVTERVRAEQEARRARDLFEGIAEATPDLLVVFDPHSGRNLYANGRFEEVLGYPAAQVRAMGDLRRTLLHADDMAALQRPHTPPAAGAEHTFQARHADGSVRCLSAREVQLRVGESSEALVLSLAQDVTERQRSQALAQEQTLRLRLALEASGLGLWELDLGSGVITRSEEARRVLGVSEESADLDTDIGRIPPEERGTIQAAIAAALHGSQSRFTLRHRFRGDDGQERWIERHGLLERGPDGVAIRIIGTCQDVGARVQAEAELRAGKARLEAALEHGQLGLWEYDLDEGTNHWMGAMHELYGLSPGEPGGDFAAVFFERVHPDDHARVLSASDAAIAQDVPFDETFRVIWPSGVQRWIRSTARLQRAGDGMPWKLLGVNYDVTELRSAELALRDLNAELDRRVTQRTRELEAILESMPDAVYVGGADGITRANGVALEMLGFTGLDDLNQNIAQLAERAQVRDPETGVRLTPEQEPFVIALSGQANVRDELIRHLGSGEDRLIRVAAAPVMLDGEVISAVAVASDHTERRAQELALREANAQLMRSNTELERFAYITSHDLQEPIRTVSSFAGLLERRYGAQLDETGRRSLGMLLSGTARMKALVDDLLSFSRLSGEHAALRSVDLNVPLAEALSRLAARLSETGAQLTHDPLPTVLGDGPQLAQLFQNLLGNALKFTRPGVRPEIHVGVRQADQIWHLSVADNGIGIEPEYLERIFEMFQRLHTRDQYEGTGLGLSVCRKIVERHGGQLWAHRGTEVGAVFEFTLPGVSEALE